jgi:hypothetical protein
MGSGASIHNTGTWEVQNDVLLSNVLGGAALFVNETGGTLQKSSGSGTTSVEVPFTNAGAVRALAGTLAFIAGYAQSAGSTSVEGGVISSPTPLDIQGGAVAGSGTVAASVTSAGRLAPGLSPGALTISGTYTQTAAGAFDVEIGGLSPGTEHDHAVVSGVAVLAGGLAVSLANGFSPADLDTFTIMSFPSSAGTFTALDLPTLGGDLVWKIHYNPTSIVLEILADLDGDGVRNLSDCAPLDPTAWSLPAEVAGVVFGANQQTLSWGSLAAQAGPALTYDLMRGLISQQPVGGGAAETCLAPDTGATQSTDASIPAIGAGLYYLVRGTNVCGVGTYGSTSAGAPRNTAACP